MEISITKAEPKHAKYVARLVSMADEQALMANLEKPDLKTAIEEFEKSFLHQNVYFSHENIYVAKSNERVAGCILFFRGLDELKYWPSPLQDSFRETDDDEMFIDSLAIDVDMRGHGIAKLLINRVISDASQQGMRKVSLLVDTTKPHLIEMYSRMGFKPAKLIYYDYGEFQKMIYAIPTREGSNKLLNRAFNWLGISRTSD